MKKRIKTEGLNEEINNVVDTCVAEFLDAMNEIQNSKAMRNQGTQVNPFILKGLFIPELKRRLGVFLKER